MLKKKEKLEQMRELGRGGLSKGLHFLRSAAVNSSVENNETLMSSTASEGESETQTTNRMTYDELVALSMKLTRQNKLMKVQYQKNQNNLIAAETNNVDVQILRGFLEHEVGLDVTACVKKASSLSGGTIDMKALTEKYRILAALKQQELQHETKAHVAVESVNLLELSPLVTKKKYEEIDLVGDTGEMKQMNEVMEQIERMSEQLKQGTEYTKKLEQKLAERDEQQEVARRVLEEEIMRLKEQEEQWREKWEEQSKLVDELMGKQEQGAAVSTASTIASEVENEVMQETKALLEVQRADLEAANAENKCRLEQIQMLQETASTTGVLQDKVKEKMATALEAQQSVLEATKAENARLQEQVQALQEASSTIILSEDGVKEKVSTALEAQQSELEAAKAENARLQEQVQALQEASSTIILSEDGVKEKVSTALEAQQSELEAAKAENARLQEQVQALQEASSTIILSEDGVKEKVSTALEAQQSELEAAKGENARLPEQVQALQEASSTIILSEDGVKEKVSTALEAQQSELEAAKAENARLPEQVQALQEASSTIILSEDGVKENVSTALEAQQSELEAAKAENARLQEQVQALQEASSTIILSEDGVKENVSTALEAQQSELEAAKGENARLPEQVQALQEASSTIILSEDGVKEKVSTALEAQQSELEAAKAENARLQKKVKALHQTTSIWTSEAQMGDAEGIINSLRAEIDCLQGMVAAKCDSEGLQQELAVLKEQAQMLQEELCQKDSNNAADAVLMQELEQIRLASAEQAHEMHVLQEKLYAAEERLAKANSDGEATQSLVKALKDDTSRLVDQVTQFEEKQVASEEKISALTEVKRELEERQEHAHEAKATMEKQLEEERAYWTSKLENLISDTDAAKSKTETLEAKLRKKEKQVTKMAASQTSMTSELIELQKQVTSMREDLSMAAEGLEAHATKAEESERRYLQSEKEVAKLKKQLDEVHEEHHANFEMLRQEKEAELKSVHIERRALSKEKKKLLREKEELQARCKGLECELGMARKHEEELETSLSDKTFQVGNLSADLAEKKKSLSDRMALATRLQTENMDMAGKLAEQVVLIESALRDAANSKAAQCEMENQVQVAKADVQRMKQSEAKAIHDLENVQREMVNKDESFQLEREKTKEVLQAAVRNEKQNFRREFERLEAESKQKSKLALQAVLQKENEITRLRARLDELEEDVRSGGADNRKILEFAELQAKREVEARTQAAQMQALTEQLEEAYRELQELRENKHRHAEELNAMLQDQRRDGVNMEYLKNVVVQYMSFQPGSSQQERLIPVLSTLLQFTAADVKEIKDAATRGNSWTSWRSSDASLDYKPIVVGGSHRHPMSPASSATGRTSTLARMASAPMSPPESSRASSFLLPNGSNGESTER
ncbi:unnamed protein product [Peronospora farinosa]|uniref:GRIP domain-containing protein n=1 Tax=Peronospora farinosa TaxID=134698 RepID=A0AAV0U2S8_9STRA|nr:unnamed protein product [Peronospora farinosa]CAI5731069.1 unnamed protein product [Peronospora farinosa]